MQESLPDWLLSPQTPAQQVVANALQQPEIAALFTSKPGQEVYNEQPIEAITKDNEWLSGTIDRLVLTVDAQGKATAAHIIDFKTNQLDPDQEKSYDALKKEYTAQMTAYRKHVANALELNPSAVSVSLLSCPLGVKARIVPC
jgi:ATP-dependent exoDNAse (exonuclease V) beta subunit